MLGEKFERDPKKRRKRALQRGGGEKGRGGKKRVLGKKGKDLTVILGFMHSRKRRKKILRGSTRESEKEGGNLLGENRIGKKDLKSFHRRVGPTLRRRKTLKEGQGKGTDGGRGSTSKVDTKEGETRGIMRGRKRVRAKSRQKQRRRRKKGDLFQIRKGVALCQ